MLKKTHFFLNFGILFIINCCFVSANAVDVSARSAILILADSGSILFEKNPDEPLAMASTTKIMTSLLTCEKIAACGNSEIEITEEMVRVEGTSMGLMPGDIVKLDALVKGMLMCSGNDAANTAAIAVSGNAEKFIELMNEKAKQIGMKNTKFETPSGLDEGDHHSTARDMATLGTYAMENDFFSEIARQKSMKVQFVNPCKTVCCKNHNKLLRICENCIGVKTGFTKKAGRCLVSCAEKMGIRLICVTLNAPSDWDDHMKLYDFGFENTKIQNFDDRDFSSSIPVKSAENAESVVIKGGTSFKFCFKKDENPEITRTEEIAKILEAPIRKGDIVGKITYKIGDRIIGQNEVFATEDLKAKKKPIKNFFKKIGDFFKNIF